MHYVPEMVHSDPIVVDDDDDTYAETAPAPVVPKKRHYFPPLIFSDFWVLRETYIQINQTDNAITVLPLNVTLNTMSSMKYQFQVQMDEAFGVHVNVGSMGEGETDDFKHMMLDTNPYLLAVTMVVSLLHSVFDFLAFKNGTCMMTTMVTARCHVLEDSQELGRP